VAPQVAERRSIAAASRCARPVRARRNVKESRACDADHERGFGCRLNNAATVPARLARSTGAAVKTDCGNDRTSVVPANAPTTTTRLLRHHHVIHVHIDDSSTSANGYRPRRLLVMQALLCCRSAQVRPGDELVPLMGARRSQRNVNWHRHGSAKLFSCGYVDITISPPG